MDAKTILLLVDALIGLAFKLYSSIKQIKGEEAIPSFDEIIQKNIVLQGKIDSE